MKKISVCVLAFAFFLVVLTACGANTQQLSADGSQKLKQTINQLVEDESHRIGELSVTNYNGNLGGEIDPFRVAANFRYPSDGGFFSFLEESDTHEVSSVSNTLYLDQASGQDESMWKNLNLATLQACIPSASKQDCENLLTTLGADDRDDWKEGFSRKSTLNSVCVGLSFKSKDPRLSSSLDSVRLMVYYPKPQS